MSRTYYEQKYCDKCVMVHWVELTRRQTQICHGETYSPHGDPTHYTRRLGHGIEVIEKRRFELVEKKINLPIVWQMALEEREPELEPIDQNQETGANQQ